MRVDKRMCDFVVRYGNLNEVHRGFHDTYANVKKEYNKIKLGEGIAWKELVWEPLDQEDYQEVLHFATMRSIELFRGRHILVPEVVIRP